MAEKALIYVRVPGAQADQQQRACLEYCSEHGYVADSICRNRGDAVALASDGVVQVVVTAYDDSVTDPGFAGRLRAAGARLEYVRPPRHPHSQQQLGVGDLVAGMRHRGASVELIAKLLDRPTREIRITLGEPPREQPRE